MKYRKLLILLLVMSVWGGTMIFADSAAQKVRVVVNGSELDDAGILSDGKTYLSVRQVLARCNHLSFGMKVPRRYGLQTECPYVPFSR